MLSYVCCPWCVEYSNGRGGYGGYEQPISNSFLAAVASTVDPSSIGFFNVFLTITVTHFIVYFSKAYDVVLLVDLVYVKNPQTSMTRTASILTP